MAEAIEGRGWQANLRREGRLTVAEVTRENPYEYEQKVLHWGG